MRFSTVATAGIITGCCSLVALAAAPAPKKAAPAKAAAKPATTAAPKPTGPALAPEVVAFFEKEVRPVLAEQCYSCHGPKIQQANLRMDSRGALLRGGARGPSLIAGDVDKSLMIQAVRHQGLQMPPGRKLPEKQVAALEQWVKMGAPWPGAQVAVAPGPKSWDEVLKARKDWWSLQPVRKPAVPAVKNGKWSAHPVDRFILSALEKKGLTPAATADRRTLARRVHLTLTGLPPTPEEIAQFVDDPSPNAYERLVDRALASPHYGERWARHWLDVVRFGETHGYEWNYEVTDAWRYRDYLIRAFNMDVPYDQLIREHIAGDLLERPRWSKDEQPINESLIGTAFFRFGENGHDVFKEIGLDVLDNQIDTLSKAFQATTVSCARCHDHKLDAVSTKDYYGMLGILVSTRQVVHTLDADTNHAAKKQRLKELKSQIQQELAGTWSRELGDAGRYLRAAQAVRAKAADAEQLAQGLDAGRLQAWVKALEKQPGLEDPLYAWSTTAANADPAAAWKAAAERYAAETKARAEFNQKNFTSWGDFRTSMDPLWRIDGAGLRDGPARSGEFVVAVEGDRAVWDVLPAGLYTHALSERLNGSMQSPWLPKGKRVSLQVVGSKGGVVRTIPDQRQLTDSGRDLPQSGPAWITVGSSDRDDWVYLELITKYHNPRYAGNPGEDPRSFFGITRAVIHNGGEAPRDELGRMARLFAGPEPKTLDEAAARYTAAMQQAAAAWAGGKATDDDAQWLSWLLRQGLVSNSLTGNARLTELVAQYRAAEKEVQSPRVVAGVADLGPGFDVPVFVRGDFRQAGDMAPRGYLGVLCGPGETKVTGSGRRDLAEEIANPKNPLTARVMVNRIWHHLFGTGLVRTTDDFGHMGETPSHPELLDYLATRFMADGWSTKRLVRTLMQTKAFQMSSQISPKAVAVEPENRLLHHYPARRLEAEVIRDSILAISGRLDRSLYGPSIQPHRLNPKPERRLFPGPLDGNGRRSVYTKVTLMQGPQFLEVFNFPDPKVAVGRRDVTNVPAQALTLMNDPFVLGQAEFWAKRLVEAQDASVAARVEGMFRTALGRAPSKDELARFEQAVRELATLHGAPEADVLKSVPVWKDVAHAVFNLKEFIYLR